LDETEHVKCPSCGAPYRDVIPADVVQVKCKYCGGVFHVPPTIGAEVFRCVNHPEKVAVGMCNDCGRSFCACCLHSYNLATRGESATLYLCPDCLKARYDKKVQGYIVAGAFMLLMGALFTIASPVPGVLFLVLGLVSLFYGVSSRPGAIQESTVDEFKTRQEEKKAELAEYEGVDYEAIYDELITRYVNHWGASLGIQLLDDEISACMRHGQSFPEAVIAVYRRQEKKPVNQESS
jgi:predicted Zn finger-like uncharacterized protein